MHRKRGVRSAVWALALLGVVGGGIWQPAVALDSPVADGCGDAGRPTHDIASLEATVDDQTMTVSMTLCQDPGAAPQDTRYAVFFDSRPPSADDNPACAATQEVRLRRRVKRHGRVRDQGPGTITQDGNTLIFTIDIATLAPESDTVFVWAHATGQGRDDRTPNTDKGDRCRKPQNLDEVIEVPVGSGNSNNPPIAVIGPDQTVATGTPVQLDGSDSFDPDGDLLTFFWRFRNTPAESGATLEDPDTETPSFFPGSVSNDIAILRGFTYRISVLPQDASDRLRVFIRAPGITPDLPGTYEVELVVSDGQLESEPVVTQVVTDNIFQFGTDVKEFQSVGPTGVLVGICLAAEDLGSNNVTFFSIAADGPIRPGIPTARGGALGFVGQIACLDIILE